MGFDLENYETVKQRKKKFYSDYPKGRILVKLLNSDLDEKAVVMAEVYTDEETHAKSLPKASGMALEVRDKEIRKSTSGRDYESVNFSSWLENAEESAIGRALDNMGYAGNDKCSREEMEKAKRNVEALKNNSTPAIAQKSDSAQQPKFNNETYTIPFGKKFIGKKLNEINHNELASYISWLEDSSAKEKKQLGDMQLDFINRAKAFLSQAVK